MGTLRITQYPVDPEDPFAEITQEEKDSRLLGETTEEEDALLAKFKLKFNPAELEPPYSKKNPPYAANSRSRVLQIRDAATGLRLATIERMIQNDFHTWILFRETPDSYLDAVTDPDRKHTNCSSQGDTWEELIVFVREQCGIQKVQRLRQRKIAEAKNLPFPDPNEFPESASHLKDSGTVSRVIQEPDSSGKIPDAPLQTSPTRWIEPREQAGYIRHLFDPENPAELDSKNPKRIGNPETQKFQAVLYPLQIKRIVKSWDTHKVSTLREPWGQVWVSEPDDVESVHDAARRHYRKMRKRRYLVELDQWKQWNNPKRR